MEFDQRHQCVILASSCLSHLVVHDHVPAYTCIEPTSHLANAAKLSLSDGDSMRELQPGETLSGTVSLEVYAHRETT